MGSRRKDLGSWLEGAPGAAAPDDASAPRLPAEGPGALAPLGRRIVAVSVDWALSLAVSAGFFPDTGADLPWLFGGHQTATLLVFGVSTAVLVALLGTTVGHRLTGLQVVPWSRPVVPAGPPGARAAVVRTALLCVVLPAVVWDRHGRGLHDVAAGTVLVRR